MNWNSKNGQSKSAIWYRSHPNYHIRHKINCKKRYQNNPEWYVNFRKLNQQRIKLRVLQKISGLEIPVCNCNCNDLRALEKNHKNLGGAKERILNKHIERDILSGKRGVDDLEVTCRVCNSAHYLFKKYGLVFKVQFIGNLGDIINKKMSKERRKTEYVV